MKKVKFILLIRTYCLQDYKNQPVANLKMGAQTQLGEDQLIKGTPTG